MVRRVSWSRTRGHRPYLMIAVTAVLALASCGKKNETPAARSDTTSVASRLVGGPVSMTPSGQASDSVLLAEVDDSRAYYVKSRDSSAIVWSVKDSSGWRRVWRSRDLLGAPPKAELQDLNGDGRADLFSSIEYEELVGGMVVLRGRDGVTELPLDVEHCRRPELQSADHQPLVVAYLSGAYTSDECEDPSAQVCLRRFQIAWPQFYRVEGEALVAFRRNPAFYRDLSARYRKDASELQRLVDSERNINKARRIYGRCPPETPQRMRKLADSALTLAG